MRRTLLAVFVILAVYAASLQSQNEKKTEADCDPVLQFGERVILTQGQFYLESPRAGQYMLGGMYLVLPQPTHPLRTRLTTYAEFSRLNPVTLAIEPDRLGTEEGSYLTLYGKLNLHENIFELEARPPKGERFDPVRIGLVTANPCIIRDLRAFSGKWVLISFQRSTGT